MNKTYCIYKHTNLINRKVYIGQTYQDPIKRWGKGVMRKKGVMIKLKSSRGEIKICDILDNAGFDYKEEYSFSDLVSSSGRPL